MNDFKDTLKKFSYVFGDEGDLFGKISFRSSASIVYPQELPSSDGLLQYFTHLELNGKAALKGEFYLRLFRLDELIDAQVGWRWIKGANNSLIENKDWSECFVIFADRNGDAIFIDTSQSEGPVYGSVQQVNKKLLASSINEFLLILCDCREIEKMKFNFETQDDDFNYKPEFIEKIRGAVEKYGGDKAENMINFFFG